MSNEGVRGYQYWKLAYDTRVALRVARVQICMRDALRVTRIQICTRDAITDTRVQHASCIYKESCTELDISKGKNN